MLGASLQETNRFQMACALRADRRWVMTGACGCTCARWGVMKAAGGWLQQVCRPRNGPILARAATRARAGTPTPSTQSSGLSHLHPLLTFLHHQPYGSGRCGRAPCSACKAAPAYVRCCMPCCYWLVLNGSCTGLLLCHGRCRKVGGWDDAVKVPFEACRPYGRERLLHLLQRTMIRWAPCHALALSRAQLALRVRWLIVAPPQPSQRPVLLARPPTHTPTALPFTPQGLQGRPHPPAPPAPPPRAPGLCARARAVLQRPGGGGRGVVRAAWRGRVLRLHVQGRTTLTLFPCCSLPHCPAPTALSPLAPPSCAGCAPQHAAG